MKRFNYTVAGFNLGVAIFNSYVGQPIIGGIVLFCAVVSYRLAGEYE